MNERQREEIVKKLNAFEPPLLIREADMCREFPEGGLFICKRIELSDEVKVLAHYPFEEGQKKVSDNVRRLLRTGYRGCCTICIKPRKRVNYLTQPMMCLDRECFYGEAAVRNLIETEAKYARNPDGVSIFYLNDSWTVPEPAEVYLLLAVSSYPYEEVGEEVEAKYPFQVTHMSYEFYKKMQADGS